MTPHLEDVLAAMATKLDALEPGSVSTDTRRPSRWVGADAAPDFVELVARGDSHRTATPTALHRRDGRKGFVPWLATKALAEATDTSGGLLVPPELAAEILMPLRARSVVLAMGATVVPVAKELDVAALSLGAAASYVAENAPIPTSEETFAVSVVLRPKALAALVPISNRLLRDASNPSVEAVVRRDLVEVMALRADLAFLQGTGTSGEPTGIVNTPGLTPAPSLGANGGVPTFDSLKDTVANLRVANAPFERPGWIFHPRTINTLEKVKDTTGRYLADSDLMTFDATGGGGTLLGYPFRSSTQIPTNLTAGSSTDTSYIAFSSDWQEVWVGEEQGLALSLSQEASYTSDGSTWNSAFQSDQTLVRAIWRNDVGLRRPSLVSVMRGVRP